MQLAINSLRCPALGNLCTFLEDATGKLSMATGYMSFHSCDNAVVNLTPAAA